MPKFVSGSSGHIYGPSKANKNDEEEDVEALLIDNGDQKESVKKPSAINKKGAKEKQKNSLDLFKEELRKLHEERLAPKKKLKSSSKDQTSPSNENSRISQLSPSTNTPVKPLPVPIPLKPDPRCPTTLTLQVNLNPKDRDSSMLGSYDTGDPTTTNLYLGNINPIVNENDLCNLFGKYGPLASIKIMWPRTDEERARNRNSGFVAYMSRIDADRALKALNGKNLRGYDMKLGWGKAVPIPQKPVYVPPELLKLTLPPPQSGLPFNGQLHPDDIARGYCVPNPHPKPLPVELESEVSSNPNLRAIKETYDEFVNVMKRATVRVIPPSDRVTLDLIHKTIEYLIREGPVFEAIIIARESKNPVYRFLYDNQSQEHIYYRWKLYSLLHGDDPYIWRTEEFRMFEGGSMWKPPLLNPYADGMPLELIQQITIDEPLVTPKALKKSEFLEKSVNPITDDSSRTKGTLGKIKREMLGNILRNLKPTKVKIGSAMMFCINHSDAAAEIVECIYESLKLLETPFHNKLARLFLISDILHNCSASVTNASYYRKGFQAELISIFEHLREYLINIEDRYKADKFKQKILCVLGAWKEWTLYEDEFVIKLSNILLGIRQQQSKETLQVDCMNVEKEATMESRMKQQVNKEDEEDDLDGFQVDEETFALCLESKGLSLRWYRTLELSDDEEEEFEKSSNDKGSRTSLKQSSPSIRSKTIGSDSELIRFKASKWETIDPTDVAEQVVTISKWEAMAKAEDDESAESTTDGSTNCDVNEVDESNQTHSQRVAKNSQHSDDENSCSP